MSPLIVRPATQDDTPQMAELLNEIIAIGGTTAFLEPVSPQDVTGWMEKNAERSSWHVAVDESGQILGYQWANPHRDLPAEAASMASFVRVGCVGLGIGSKLFAATTARTRALGYTWLNATILSDNASGISYYEKMGFVTWREDEAQTLTNGRCAGRVHKRRDL